MVSIQHNQNGLSRKNVGKTIQFVAYHVNKRYLN